MRTLLLINCLFFISTALYSQYIDPTQWAAIVQDPLRNTSIKDTFLIQTFDGIPADNWLYESTGVSPVGTEPINDTNVVKGGKGKNQLLIAKDNAALFSIPNIDHENITVSLSYGGAVRDNKHVFIVETHFTNGDKYNNRIRIRNNATTLNYGEPANWNGVAKVNPLLIEGKLSRIVLKGDPDYSQGYFVVDRIFAYRDAPTYSLFSGSGQWHDPVHWSHQIPSGNRTALFTGEMNMTENAICHELWMHKGRLNIQETVTLEVDDLHLYENELMIHSSGEMKVNNKVSQFRTFPQTGTWYFISFPFDVYTDGIDPSFSLKDEKPNSGGDYLYVMTYDGDARTVSGEAKGNWSVIPVTHPADKPLFERGKGYLVALDEKANKQVISFSSPGGITYNKETIHIPISIHLPSAVSDHFGWVLCGNPLPSPLSLKQIHANRDLDGYIYVYDGTAYQPYPIGSDCILPPFSAFFVKARTSTELNIDVERIENGNIEIPVSDEVKQDFADPSNPIVTTPNGGSSLMEYSIEDGFLYVRNDAQPGNVSITHLSGQQYLNRNIPSGSITIPLSLPRGVYIIRMQAGSYQAQDKFIINQ